MSDYLNQSDNETKEMLASFVDETMDSLDKFEPQIDSLSEENNFDSVNAIFRVFHTIKGLSGFFGLEEISRLTHQAETLLDKMRDMNIPQSEEAVNLIYANFDLLRKLVANVSTNQTDTGFENEINSMIEKLKSFFEEEIESEVLIQEVADSAVIDTIQEIQPDNYDDLISDDMMKIFIEDSVAYLNKTEQALVEFESSPDKEKIINDAFCFIHSIKGNAGFIGISEIEKDSMELESMLVMAREDAGKFGPADINKSFSILDRLSANVKKLEIKVFGNKGVTSETPTKKEDEVKPKSEPDTEIKPQIPLPVINVEMQTEKAEPSIRQKEEESAKSDKPENNISAKQAVHQKKDIRVDTQKLDSLFDLVGELITIESMIINNADIRGKDMPNFAKAAGMLSKITRELQEISMSLRMTPLDALFNKMKRLVRDLAQKSEKKIELTIFGEETEMDKNVIEEISDPLVHIIRNAIDHGIEKSEARISKGKPAVGHLTLGAGYEGNEIIITIRDDGNGLDRDRILRKALEKGLVEESETAKLRDSEVWDFIFNPGFSTAEKVTNISGRGVGMDVVKKNIEKLRGSVSIESHKGQGSVFKLRIPLTLAIMDSMLAAVSNTTYALPILSIQESFRPKKEEIFITMDGNEQVKIRGKIYPVIRIHEFLNKNPKYTNLEDGILIRIESGNTQACLFVDEIVGQQQTVIKGLSDYIGKVSGITGGMILGNGEVGLILDVDTILKKSVN